jgi:hypothetical protein
MVIRVTVPLGILAASISPAAASDPTGGVNPCADLDICVVVTEPGGNPSPGSTSPGSGGGNGGVEMCTWNGQQWPCWDNDLGWFNTSDGCYYHRSDPQPPADDPSWGGHKPADGAVYEVNCRGVGGQLTPKPPMFFAQPPGGAKPDQPVELGWQAYGRMHFNRPMLHASPPGTAVVGAPVWLYTTVPGPAPGVARGQQLTLTATATFKNIVWETGDQESVTCTDPGTPYRQGATSTCTHTYRTSSAAEPDGKYYLAATVNWDITVVDNTGRQWLHFVKPVTSAVDQSLPLAVGEVQVLN